MDKFANLLQQSYLGNTVYDYVVALGVFLLSLIIFSIIKNHVLGRLKKWAKKTKTDVDDEIVETLEQVPGILYFFAALYIALNFIVVHEIVTKIVEIILTILLIYWATRVIGELIEYLLSKVAKDQKGKKEKNTTYFALNMIAKVILWSVGLLLILSNLGVNISALIASLGIGGIAVALALQNILSDMFSSFSIYIDKPFEIGDFIIVGEHMGTVKKIGLKTTRIEALQGEEIVISNNELTSSRVRNFKKMKKRRVVFHIGVTYDTPSTKLKKIPKIVKEYITKTPKCTFDRCHFFQFGPSSLDYEIVYYVQSSNYNDYMNTQQKLNLELVKSFEKEKIEFAFPTQTIHLANTTVKN
jgi:small-conductance mechanosensitive channel